MGEVIVLSETSREKRVMEKSLNDWLKELAQEVRQPDATLSDSVVKVESVRKSVEQSLIRQIFGRRLIESDIFLCASYVAELVAQLNVGDIEEWYLVDHWPAGKSEAAHCKPVADICFLLCAFFPKRAKRRQIEAKYYRRAGISLYHDYYTLTGKVIGHLMAQRFETMESLVGAAFAAV